MQSPYAVLQNADRRRPMSPPHEQAATPPPSSENRWDLLCGPRDNPQGTSSFSFFYLSRSRAGAMRVALFLF
jgi:hypothetical protein